MPRNQERRGFFRIALDGLVAARTRQVNRYLNGTLLMLDDDTLKLNGYSREDLKKNSINFRI